MPKISVYLDGELERNVRLYIAKGAVSSIVQEALMRELLTVPDYRDQRIRELEERLAELRAPSTAALR